MARYRKLFMVSSIGLAAIVMALFSQQLVDLNRKQNQPIYAEFESERAVDNQASVQSIPADENAQKIPSTIENQSFTKEPPEVITEVDNITVSGWVGTEFGENVPSETVVLYSPSLRARYSITTGISGEYVFADLKPAWDYVLKVSPRGMFKRYIKSPIKLKSSQEVHNIVLEAIPVGVLTGRIVDPYGRPVAGLELLIQTVEIDSWSTSVITDANGTFSVAEFPKGRLGVTTRGQQILRATGLEFDPDTRERANLTIDLGPYNLVGRIYDESGQTFDGADVILIWALNENGIRIRSTRRLRIDAGGEFRFTGLGPGDHELVVSAWRGSTFKQTVKQTVNVGVDSEDLMIVFNTLQD